METKRNPERANSPEGRRGDRRKEACELLREAREAAGLSTELLATDAGCTRNAIQKMEDVSDIGHPVHADVYLAPAIARDIVRVLARRAGMIAFEIPANAHDSYALEALAKIQRETSDVVSTALTAMSDGHVDRRENAEIRRQLDEAIEALAKFKRALEMTSAESSVPVRAIGGLK